MTQIRPINSSASASRGRCPGRSGHGSRRRPPALHEEGNESMGRVHCEPGLRDVDRRRVHPATMGRSNVRPVGTDAVHHRCEALQNSLLVVAQGRVDVQA